MILLYTLKSIAFALTEPYLVLILAILVFTLYRKNKQTVIMQKMIIGEGINSPFELTISQIVIGIFGGILASVIMSYLGVVFDEDSAVDLIFLASIVFMFFNVRFICFSYSGAILGFLSLILAMSSQTFNIPNLDFLKIDVVALMSMVAILHFVEGILIILDGKKGAVPVFSSKNGNIVGGFALQRYWTIPIAVFFIIHSRTMIGSSWQVAVPAWWPLINSSIPYDILKSAVVSLIPFYAVMGYNSVTFTRDTKEKSFLSGGLIILYSVILFGMAQLAVLNIWLKFLVVIFAPVAHEGIIMFQRHLEVKGVPKYVSSSEGIMVLAVAPNSPANEMGIRSGDMLVEINNEKIDNEDKIAEVIRKCSNFIWLKVKKEAGNFEQVSYSKMNEDKKLGIVFVPRKIPQNSMVIKLDKNKFSDVLNKIKNKDKDD
ncbi:PDZ domain-containing protein [Clostridium sp. MT-14]|uniref:PDZ domain-containing protein n=1 Tax=Clostridium aromativorans TaxID=2836848 RepID=A0ABS8NBC7_9CLOT|nr:MULTISPECIES: PDZ domain-containing protein [Clostridium]KAA8674550.1 PDZ domain-containing protein [Clostridium sp. HV4-5-A1G]MCC9296375.1 PDZ domain-containing protein [Clostridium aromativorans]